MCTRILSSVLGCSKGGYTLRPFEQLRPGMQTDGINANFITVTKRVSRSQLGIYNNKVNASGIAILKPYLWQLFEVKLSGLHTTN